MPNRIKMTDDMISKIIEDLKKMKIVSETTIKVSSEKVKKDNAILRYSYKAWAKFKALVESSSLEIGWYGLTRRVSDNEWECYDIIMYPQSVTGATITADEDKYSEWLMSLDDDTFNNMKLFGHSHVRMGTTPSGVDNGVREKIIAQFNDKIEDDQYYIFTIYNKDGDHTITIYDWANDLIYNGKEVDIVIGDGEVDELLEDVKEKVETSTYSYSRYNATKTSKVQDYKKAESKSEKKSENDKKKSSMYDDAPYYGAGWSDDEWEYWRRY